MPSYMDKIKKGFIPHQKKQPIYFLIDISYSMAIDDKITMVNSAIKKMINKIFTNRVLSSVAHISFITFNDTAEAIVPLTPADEIQTPSFTADGNTHMGEALKLLTIEIEKNDESYDTPAVFLLSDGAANDDLISGVMAIKKIDFKKQFYAIAVGKDAEIDQLRSITPLVFQMERMREEDFRDMFSWFAQIVEVITLTDSKQLTGGGSISLTSKEGLTLLKGGSFLTGLPSSRSNQRQIEGSGQLMLPPPPSNIKKR